MRGRVFGNEGRRSGRMNSRRASRRTGLIAALVIGGFAAAGANPAWGQDSAGGVEIKPFVGLYSPLSSLADQGDTLQVEMSTAVAFGADVTYWLPSGLGVTGLFAYSSPDVTSQDLSMGFPIRVSFGNADVLFFGGSLMYRPNLSGAASIVRPYFGVGAGARRVTFPADPGLSFEDGTSVAGILSGGADVTLNDRVLFSLGVRDFISSFDDPVLDDSKRQHDIVLSAGFAVRLN
ncbi:MAG: hypothetical protein ABFS14_07840 [Gemmatimonadota bacterium]